MKRVVLIILSLVLILAAAGCGAKENSVVVNPNATPGATATGSATPGATTAKTGNTPSPGASSASPSDGSPSGSGQAQDDRLYFETNGVKIHAYDLAKDVLAALGAPKGTFEAPSCAYQGKDLFYYYKGFQLTVNELDGVERVTEIMVVDDTVANPQGVKIGATQDDMLARMGKDYTPGAEGVFQFIKGTTTLQIQIKKGAVAAITYTYVLPKK